MRWHKLGHLFAPQGDVPWMRSHAANPVAEHIVGNCFRVYFSPRDEKGRGQIASVTVEIDGERAGLVNGIVTQVLAHGRNGRFDDSGVTVTGLVRRGRQRILYFLGWNLGVTVPFRNAIGAAVAEDDGTFRRVSEAPIADRSEVDPISLSYPFVLWDEDRFRIWYGSCIDWTGSKVDDYRFSLKYAESANGLAWQRTGEVVLDCRYPDEDAVARPHVVHECGIYRMWYSRKRDRAYRIGYAESADGRRWERLDEQAGIDVSPGGEWDSEMIEYPFVFDHAGRRYMLYNGNDYGRSGFGLAVAE